MKFSRNKRQLLGFVAFLAPLPLPFNEPRPEGVVGFPFLALYLFSIALFLREAGKDSEFYLRPWMMNVLGLLYLPFLFLDVTLLWAGSLVRPMMHLALFALAAKLFSLRAERDKWHAFVGIFFVFVTAMATSTHPVIVLYMIAFATLSMLILTRFVYLHLKDLHESPGRLILGPRSIKRFVALSAILVNVIAVPIFMFMPRLSDPYLTAKSNAGTDQFGTGFSDRVTLDVIGNIRSSREIAMRMELPEEEPPLTDFRLKGATYDVYAGVGWEQTSSRRILRPDRGAFRLSQEEGDSSIHVWLQPLKAHSLILPTEAVSVQLKVPALRHGLGGAISLYHEPRGTLEYDVVLANGPVLTGADPSIGEKEDGSLDLTGVSEAITEFAAQIAEDGDAAERARRIESHLIREYEYTLDFLRRRADNPIEDFLFTYKSGHCEYFASAMVLMLRAEGIPARFVTGFLGAEYNPIEGYYIVRQSNAHAWVEAWLPEQGWVTFDPTPPSGRPTTELPSFRLLLRQSYEHVIFLWDRSVLSFGSYEQGRLASAARERLRAARAWLEDPTFGGSKENDQLAPQMTPGSVLAAGCLAFVLVGLGGWLTRPRYTATTAFLRLRRQALRTGVDAEEHVPPGEVVSRIVLQFPDAREPSERLLDLYLRESFRGDELDPESSRVATESFLELRRLLKEAS